MSRTFLTGDIHGELSIDRLSSGHFKEGKDLTKEDNVIVLGDFGLIFRREASDSEVYWLDWLDKKPWTTIFVDGNHENFDRLNQFPEVDMFGAVVGKINDSVFHLKRGYIYDIRDSSYFVFGGGFSIDQAGRTEGYSWWPQELPSSEEYDRGYANLKKHNNCVDYILTHTCSTSMFDDLNKKTQYDHKIFGEEGLRDFLQIVQNTVQYTKWFFGHFHTDYTFGKHTAMYEDIIELKQ